MQIFEFDEKQPYEEYYVAFDFSNVISSCTIADATVTVTDEDGSDVTNSLTDVAEQAIDTDNSQVNVFVTGGTSGERYKITCQIETDSDPVEKYELEAYLPVLET